MSTTDDIMQGGLDRLPTISDEIEVSLIASDALLTTITGDIETKCRKVSLPDFPGFSKTVTTQSQVGLEKTAQITMRFPVGRAQFLSVENWNKRKVYPIPEDRCNTLCFSLGCYLRADVDRNHKNYNALRSRWPKGQQLHLTVTRRDGSSKRIPLSLPTVCTPDGLVDLGLFIRQGDNTIKISQRGDLSAYVFCLHVHEPTLAQIQRLNKVLNDDLEWGLWRKLVSRPLDLPGSLFAVSQC
ncbi:hypothetical protein J3R30DRAFT_922081 [Lentinula aciculospora]|uniref:Uncharacterized protein n=1 Tax=Lentinula aciculospora TaxID=153920 RepID=A0A9W9AQZ6_9AGAR|nr:hypothetical protein J3R30DRAFT_922081 [Lentinula aciculospora]